MSHTKEEIRDVFRKACESSVGVTKLKTVALSREQLKIAVGEPKAKELIGDRKENQDGDTVAVCPREFLEALGSGSPKQNATPPKP